MTRMVARDREQGQLKMVADQCHSPMFTPDLAQTLVEVVITHESVGLADLGQIGSLTSPQHHGSRSSA
jgi:dTDP-4-dehydrorhamnose reductase